MEVELPIKGAIVGSHSAALDLSGQVPHDRESEQSFQPCPLGKEIKGDLGRFPSWIKMGTHWYPGSGYWWKAFKNVSKFYVAKLQGQENKSNNRLKV